MTDFINKVIYPSEKKDSNINIPSENIHSDIFKYNENITCNDLCEYEYYLDKEDINNLIDKNYLKLDNNFKNKIINIYNQIKNKVVKIINDKNLSDQIGKINIDKLKTSLDNLTLINTLKSNKNTFNKALCDINSVYNNKMIFSIIISQILCKIKKCNTENDFKIIKDKIVDKIVDIFRECTV